MIRQGEIGDVYAVDLTFHNAYGPDKEWFYELAKSGGGCLLDLGIHLADLLLWVFGFPEPNAIQASMYRNGRWLGDQHQQVEDYALANWSFASGVAARLACSWRLHAGRDAVIEAIFYGTQGTLALKNVNGSFFDFCLEQYDGTTSRVLVEPPDDWGGRCIGQFARQIAISPKFHPQADELIAVARLIDRSYGR
jgi:predicted dehydrogenase